MIAVGFLLFILFTSNPFERLFPVPENGQSLNPLLQDPGLAFHPPFLYLGYVGFSIAFSFAIAALIEGKVDPAWARWVRPWTLAAWAFLTIGIVLGSWWAYYELGWGGWWFWDPVENASFMPWLAGTALLHSAIVAEKRDTLKSWTVFLAIVAFALSLLGTFLVRSGVLTSVHAFATDPARGSFILMLLIIAIGGSFALYAWRGPSLKAGGLFQPVSREGSLLVNNLLMTVGTGVVLLGTLYPLFVDVLEFGKVSVGAPFFNSVFVPIMMPMIILMAVGPFLAWKRSTLKLPMFKLVPALIAGLIGFGLAIYYRPDGPVMAFLGLFLAGWLGAGTIAELVERTQFFNPKRMFAMPRSAWGMTITHFGLAIGIAGMTGAGAWKVESIQAMKVGDIVNVSGYEYRFDGVRDVEGPNYSAQRGTFTVFKDGEKFITLRPEKRTYHVSARPTTEAAIYTTFWGDLYAVVGDQTEDGSAFVTRLYFNPLVAWMWVGATLMVFGGLFSLTDRRLRIGAPTRRRKEA